VKEKQLHPAVIVHPSYGAYAVVTVDATETEVHQAKDRTVVHSGWEATPAGAGMGLAVHAHFGVPTAHPSPAVAARPEEVVAARAVIVVSIAAGFDVAPAVGLAVAVVLSSSSTGGPC
jgi:hypothetical protein